MTKKQNIFLKLYLKKRGHVSNTCRAMNISRMSFYRWYETEPKEDNKFRQAIDEMDESFIDDSEATLHQLQHGIPEYKEMIDPDTGQIKKVIVGYAVRPSLAAVQYYLDSKARHRGYGNKSIDITSGGDKIQFVLPTVPKDVKKDYENAND